MNSSLYQSKIFHKRLKPIERQFSYGVFMFSLDLDELETLTENHWLLSRNRWNLLSIYDGDYLRPHDPSVASPQTIKQKLFEYLSDQEVDIKGIDRVTLQTFPRILGYQFNPVCFYYLYDKQDKVTTIVAEVTNTYLEKKLYLIDEADVSRPGWFRLKTAKDFYVSPFSKIDDSFDFQIGPLLDKWAVNINDFDSESNVLLSTIRGNKKPITTKRLLFFLFRYPLLTIRIIVLIHWHALIMFFRKLPVSNKQTTAHQQKDVIRPHHTLTNQQNEH